MGSRLVVLVFCGRQDNIEWLGGAGRAVNDGVWWHKDGLALANAEDRLGA